MLVTALKHKKIDITNRLKLLRQHIKNGTTLEEEA
jgi:hypothetical protein